MPKIGAPTAAVLACVLAACVLGACGEPDPILTVNELRPTLPADPFCGPRTAPDALEIRALGDFPAAQTDRLIEL